MQKFTLFVLAILGTLVSAQAQYKPVLYDYEKNYFNQGQPLPAESYLMFSGNAQKDVSAVQIEVFRPRKKHKEALYEFTWKRSYSNTSENFEVPINYKLRGGNEYDFEINTYRKASETEKSNLQSILNSSLDAYVDGVINVERRKLSFSQAPGAMIQDLNDIVNNGTMFYTNKINFQFPGFSDIIKNKLKQLKSARLRKGIFNFNKEEYGKRREAKRLYADKLVSELKNALHTELAQMINTEMMVLNDNKEIRDYPVEKTRNTIAVNVGYGGVYLSGDLKDLEYDHAPYVGLSLPMGKAAFAKPFWRNTSLSIGAFLNNMEDKDGNELTGPIFGRPYYVGLGYRAFQFIRINAGVTALQRKTDGSVFDVNLSEIKFKPFIGVSAEINLWLGLGDGKR